MTAMCDVAFLLLSFFILTTKPKSSEAINVVTPTSVAVKPAPQKDVALFTIDKNGKIFISMDDESAKADIAQSINSTRGLGINVAAFKKAEFFGTAFGQIPAFLALPMEKKIGDNLPGISIDTTAPGGSELNEWVRLIATAYQGRQLNVLLKGDNVSKYPSFKAVVDAFKKNDILKFQMVTNPESVPIGSELFKDNLKAPKKA
jgi:biopolymer transport protein ExbD